MATLRISLFGNLRISRADLKTEVRLTRIVQAFFAFLLINRHRVHPREVLSDLFWGDRPDEQARNCLNTTIWRIRRTLETGSIPKGTYLVRTPMAEVGFNCNCDYWLDIECFEKQIDRTLKKPVEVIDNDEADRLKRVLDFYDGDLLEGFYYDWALLERERMRTLYLNALEHLMRYFDYCGAYEEAINCGKKILYHDNIREEIHREVIRYYLKCGYRARAMRHYNECREILKKELGIEPMQETRALCREIKEMTKLPKLAKDFDRQQEIKTFENNTHGHQILSKLKHVMGDIQKMNNKMEEIAQLIERTIKA